MQCVRTADLAWWPFSFKLKSNYSILKSFSEEIWFQHSSVTRSFVLHPPHIIKLCTLGFSYCGMIWCCNIWQYLSPLGCLLKKEARSLSHFQAIRPILKLFLCWKKHWNMHLIGMLTNQWTIPAILAVNTPAIAFVWDEALSPKIMFWTNRLVCCKNHSKKILLF